MTARLVAACLVAAVVVGLASDARAQKRSGALRNARAAEVDPTAPEPAPGEGQTERAGQDGAGSADPFDRAAGPSAKAADKPGETEDRTASPGDPVGMKKGQMEKATFGAGCFWHVESAFEWLPGVKSAVSGYSGGSVPNPSYEEVHEGVTGHAEVVQVEYDPAVISYEQLLHVFWSHHDPTQLNRQGPDVGTQYRSVIFYHSEAQRRAALKSYRDLTAARTFPGPIVTQLMPMKAFYRAEEYHQNYYGGKDGGRAARSARSRRVRKPAAPGKGAVTAAGRRAAKAGAPAAKAAKAGVGSLPGSGPEPAGDSEP
jgi:peptide-methionine (S)-S-oxide reductase